MLACFSTCYKHLYTFPSQKIDFCALCSTLVKSNSCTPFALHFALHFFSFIFPLHSSDFLEFSKFFQHLVIWTLINSFTSLEVKTPFYEEIWSMMKNRSDTDPNQIRMFSHILNFDLDQNSSVFLLFSKFLLT